MANAPIPDRIARACIDNLPDGESGIFFRPKLVQGKSTLNDCRKSPAAREIWLLSQIERTGFINLQIRMTRVVGWIPIQPPGGRVESIFQKFLADKSGATAIEYGLITAGVAITIIGRRFQGIGTSLNTAFGSGFHRADASIIIAKIASAVEQVPFSEGKRDSCVPPDQGRLVKIFTVPNGSTPTCCMTSELVHGHGKFGSRPSYRPFWLTRY